MLQLLIEGRSEKDHPGDNEALLDDDDKNSSLYFKGDAKRADLQISDDSETPC